MPLQMGMRLGLSRYTGASLDAVGGGNSLDNYGNAAFLFDVPLSTYRNGASQVGSFSSLTGLTFTRALAAYAPNSAGVLQLFASGAPRITDRGLLIEGARTNLATYSSDWTDSSWSNSNVTVTAAAATAPDGTLTATKLSPTTSAGATMVKNVGAVAATAASYSIYVKKGSGATDANKFIMRNLTTATILVNGTLNYDTGVWTTTTGNAALVSTLANGWYRITLYASSGITSGDSIQIYTGFTGSSETAGEYAYFWGAQLEAAAFASSYIPTTTASATRAADVASIAASITAPYTMFAEVDLPAVVAGGQVYMGASDGTGNNGSAIYNAGSALVVLNKTSGSNDAVVVTAGTISANTVSRLAGRFETNNINGRFNGGALGTLDTACTVSARTQIELGNSLVNALPIFGFIKRAAVWNSAFTDANLQAVTA